MLNRRRLLLGSAAVAAAAGIASVPLVLRAHSRKVSEEVVAWLKANANNLVLIEGHCDERGTNEYNLGLGDRRARATMNYLVAQGVQASRINVVSYGEERPTCTEKTEGCWAKNRRAAFLAKEQ